MIIDQLLVLDMGTYSASTGMVGANQFGSGTTTTSTNILDMLNARDMGAGTVNDSADLTVEFLITTAYAGGASVNFQVQGSTDSTTWTTYCETGAIAIASLGAGKRVKLKLPIVNPDDGPLPRYYRAAYVNAGANTAGAVIAWLGTVDTNRYYPPGVTVSN